MGSRANLEMGSLMGRQERDRQTRRMDQLMSGLSRIASVYGRYVDFSEEDPEAFGAGHFVFSLRGDRTARWTIEERYVDSDSSDLDRVPCSWIWQEQHLRHRPEGETQWVAVREGEVASEDVDQLIQTTGAWAHSARITRVRQGFFTATSRDVPGAGHDYPSLGI